MSEALPITRPIMRYHGGKWKLAPWVISHFPTHRIYVEPFGGAASVLLCKERVACEVYNDLDEEVVNVFRVLRDPVTAEELRRVAALTPFARREFELVYEPAGDPVERARRYLVRSFFGYGSKSCVSLSRNGFRSKRGVENSPAVDWSRYPAAIHSFVERLRGVVIESRPAVDLVARYDDASALFYLDPPYVHATRNLEQAVYRYEMADADHIALSRALEGIKGMAIISGYPCAMYEALYADWQRVETPSYADKASPRTEVLWISPRAWEVLQANESRQGSLL